MLRLGLDKLPLSANFDGMPLILSRLALHLGSLRDLGWSASCHVGCLSRLDTSGLLLLLVALLMMSHLGGLGMRCAGLTVDTSAPAGWCLGRPIDFAEISFDFCRLGLERRLQDVAEISFDFVPLHFDGHFGARCFAWFW